MKRIITVFLLLMVYFVSAKAQLFQNELLQSSKINYCLRYSIDSTYQRGRFIKNDSYTRHESFSNVTSGLYTTDFIIDYIYAYDSFYDEVYFVSENCNLVACNATISGTPAKKIFKKKNKDIVFDSRKDAQVLSSLKDAQSRIIDDYYKQLIAKEKRSKFIRDSIDKRAAFVQDSITKRMKFLDDSVKYVKSNIARTYKNISDDFGPGVLAIAGANKDTIFVIKIETGPLGLIYNKIVPFTNYSEYSPVNHSSFRKHYNCFKDSLEYYYNKDHINRWEDYNAYQLGNVASTIKEKAPYGYFTRLSWGYEYNCVSITYTFCNTYPKTLKYIDVCFTVKNAVGDNRGSGHFKGTGPVDQWDTGTWSWDTFESRYYFSGDVTDLIVTKVIITYMDGSTKTLGEKAILIE